MAKIDITDTKIVTPDDDGTVEELRSDQGQEAATAWELAGTLSDGRLVYTRQRRVEKE